MQVLLASTVLRENSQGVFVLICVCVLYPSAACLFLNSAVHPKMVLPFFEASDRHLYDMNDDSVALCDIKTVLCQRAYLLFYVR